ncbi:MAG: hypothetical protein RIG77_05955 [Cyclobacteriaceae bacterium]
MDFRWLFLFFLLGNSGSCQSLNSFTEKPRSCQKGTISLRELNIPNHPSIDVGIFNSLDSLLFFRSIQLIDSTELEIDFVVFSLENNQENFLRLDKVDKGYPIEEPVGWLNDSIFLFRKTSSDYLDERQQETLVAYNITNGYEQLYVLPEHIDDVITSRNIVLFTSVTTKKEVKNILESFQYTVHKYNFQSKKRELYFEFPIGEYVSLLHYSDRHDGLTYFSNDTLNYLVQGKTTPIFNNRIEALDNEKNIEKVKLDLISWDEYEKNLYFFTSVSLSLYDEGFTGDRLYYILNRYNLTSHTLERLDTLNYDAKKRVYKWQNIEITRITKISAYHDQSFLLSVEPPYNPEETVFADIPITFGQLKLILSGEVNPNKKLYVLKIE